MKSSLKFDTDNIGEPRPGIAGCGGISPNADRSVSKTFVRNVEERVSHVAGEDADSRTLRNHADMNRRSRLDCEPGTSQWGPRIVRSARFADDDLTVARADTGVVSIESVVAKARPRYAKNQTGITGRCGSHVGVISEVGKVGLCGDGLDARGAGADGSVPLAVLHVPATAVGHPTGYIAVVKIAVVFGGRLHRLAEPGESGYAERLCAERHRG